MSKSKFAIEDGCLQIAWDDEKDCPFAGDLSDAPKVLMDNITHVRVWDDNPKWVEVKGRDAKGYKFILKNPEPNRDPDVCPEDIFGFRLPRVRVEPQPETVTEPKVRVMV